MKIWAIYIGAIIVLIAASTMPQTARAANGAYAVDAADINDFGSCKVESWVQSATNSDFAAVANPSCVVDIFKPVELTLMVDRFRAAGDWNTSIAPKAKWNIIPTAIGKLGLSFYAGGAFDAQTGDSTSTFAVVPVTYRLSEITRINAIGGWLWDRTVDRHYFLYGIGYDWKFTDVLQFTIETFGQAKIANGANAGLPDASSVTQPRLQTGVRYRPNEIFSLDLIYGRNINGENSNWITLGTTVRFPPPAGATRTPEPHL